MILAGDVSQLQAVENGGGMSLLAERLGYVRLTEPVRFHHEWEQAASLRLRDGDTSVLAAYDQHGRIIGGDPEQMMDAAAAAYVALFADGTDVLLMAADHALRRELSCRIRDDLMQLGIVAAGPAVRIADGAEASPGDLIICTRNDHTVQAGEPGRTLANGDLHRIQAITRHGLIVRRALDADPRTGQRRWTDRTFVYANYADAELGYAVTDHTAQGRTVHTGLAVITGTEDRQHAYVALSRGTDVNLAYVFTTSPKRADPAPGPRPAPELARYDQIYPERTGVRAPDTPPAPPGTPLAVLAGVLDRDGEQRSATQARNQALADADHMAILYAIWAAETIPARDQRYRDLLESVLPPGDRREPSHQAKWLWRTLRGAELAGQTPGRSWPPRSANGTWPAPATWPPSSTPASAIGSASWSRALPARSPYRSPRSPTPSAALTQFYVATTLSWLGDTAAEGIARQVLAAIEAPELRPRPRRAALARLDLALALTAADKHDEAAGVALEAVTSGRLAPVDGRRAREIVLAVTERGVPEAAQLAEAYRETCDEPGRPALP